MNPGCWLGSSPCSQWCSEVLHVIPLNPITTVSDRNDFPSFTTEGTKRLSNMCASRSHRWLNPGSNPPLSLLTLSSEVQTRESTPGLETLRAFAHNGGMSQWRQTDSALSFHCGWSSGSNPHGCLGHKLNSQWVSGVRDTHSIQTVWDTDWGTQDPFPPQEFSIFTQGRNLASLGWLHGHKGAHSQKPGKHRPCRERMDSC